MEWRERPVPAAQWRAATPVVILRGGGLGQGMREAALPNQGCGGGGGGGSRRTRTARFQRQSIMAIEEVVWVL